MFIANFGFGFISPPPGISNYQGVKQGGLISFLNNIITLLITLAGLFAFINLILAGYQYLSANGDPQKITQAGNKILQSLIGLAIVAASFIIAALVGYLLFKDASALIKPKFYFVK
jgi:hypothetical protein